MLLESRKANLVLASSLTCLPVGLGFDSVKAHLICIVVVWCRATDLSVRTTRAPPDAASAEAVEASSEEEEDPGCESKPERHTDLCLSTVNGVDTALGEEEKDYIEDEGEESDRSGETGDAGTAIGHGHLADVG